MSMGKSQSLDGDENGMGEILNIKLKDLYARGHGLSEREEGYFKGILFSPAFHVPKTSLQGTRANFYRHSNLPPAGCSVSVDFNQSRPLFLSLPASYFT